MEQVKNISRVKNNRSSNIEFFRIVMMLSIVAHHYVVNSGLLDMIEIPPYTWRHYFMFIFGMWGKIGINCFVLITGYFMCKSEITLRKFLKLALEVIFYNVVCYTVFALTNYAPFSWRNLYMAINPVNSITDSFICCFLVYYLLIPYLNVLVRNLSQRQHITLIGLCLLFFSVMIYLPRFEYRFNYVGWFCVLHVIASYLRFYEKQIILPIKNKASALVTAGIGIAVLSVLVQVFCVGRGWNVGWQYKWVIDSNAIIAVLSSVFLFLGFKELNMKSSNLINTIASCTFAVLLIHANSDTMRQWLWGDICNNVAWFNSPYMLLHAFGSVLLIYICCVLIDRLRIWVVEKPLFKIIDRIIERYE